MSVRVRQYQFGTGKVFQNGVVAAHNLLLFILGMEKFETNAMLALPTHGKKLSLGKGRVVHQPVRVMIHTIDAALLDQCAWTKFFAHFFDAFPLVFSGALYGLLAQGPACRCR